MNPALIAAMVFNMQTAQRKKPSAKVSAEIEAENRKALEELERIHKEKGLYSALQSLQPKAEKKSRGSKLDWFVLIALAIASFFYLYFSA